jgi:L-lactate dehydrogenase complex protein LldE
MKESRTKSRKPQKEKPAPPRVGLFVTCLVDLFRPSVGFASVQLIEQAGCSVDAPAAQTCCGQPAWNSGDRADARAIAEQVVATFEGFDYIVVPSGSCAGMLKVHYPELFKGDAAWGPRVAAFAARVHELTSFLADVRGATIDAEFDAKATYHDACSGLRELGVKEQPRRLLAGVKGLELVEMPDCETCCGFGGAFAVKFGELSGSIVATKTGNVEASRADLLIAGDLGCLMNMAGKLKRDGSRIEVRHVAEVLAGMTRTAPIGQRRGKQGGGGWSR